MIYRSVCANLAPDAKAPEFQLLGQGVWGEAVDLADGTITKLIRRDGGLGDGLELWTNETRALAALSGVQLPCPVPRLIAHGKLNSDTDTGDYLAWIRMSRLEGTALDDDLVAELSPTARKCFTVPWHRRSSIRLWQVASNRNSNASVLPGVSFKIVH